MSKKDQGITTIKYGELHLFYPIRFEKNISIQELRDKIQESSIVFKEEYEKEILNQLGSDMHRFTEEWNKAHGHFMQMRVVDYEKALGSDASLSDIRKKDLRIETYEQDNKLYYRLVSEELEALQERCKQMQEEYERSLKIYGSNFTDVQERFLLLPLKVTLYNQKQIWMHPFLYLFSNHMAILKLELPLFDVSTDALKVYKLNNYISGTACTWEEDVKSFTTIEEIQKFYKNTIFI